MCLSVSVRYVWKGGEIERERDTWSTSFCMCCLNERLFHLDSIVCPVKSVPSINLCFRLRNNKSNNNNNNHNNNNKTINKTPKFRFFAKLCFFKVFAKQKSRSNIDIELLEKVACTTFLIKKVVGIPTRPTL